MRAHSRLLVVLGLVLTIVCAACQPIQAPAEESTTNTMASALDDATVAEVERIVDGIMTKGQVPGAAVGIVKDGELVFAKGYGVLELGRTEPVTPKSVFSMASIAKSVVATGIMQLVADGKINLDSPLAEYLPYFTMAEPDAQGITIRELLSHTSGMPDDIDLLSEYLDPNKRVDEAALDDYVRSLGDVSLLFRPGAAWSYSDIGFDILGDVIAKVSGRSLEDYVHDRVFAPLGMSDSSFMLDDLDSAKLAMPHLYAEDGKATTQGYYPYTRTHAPSSSFYTSVEDLARFAVANMNHGTLDGVQILPASAYDEMWKPQAASTWVEMFGPQVTDYGLGWWVGSYLEWPLNGNYGVEDGFQSRLGIFPGEGLAVIAMVNLFDAKEGSIFAYEIGNGISEVLLNGAK